MPNYVQVITCQKSWDILRAAADNPNARAKALVWAALCPGQDGLRLCPSLDLLSRPRLRAETNAVPP